MGNVFSVPLFFIAIIVAVLLGLVESLVDKPVGDDVTAVEKNPQDKKRLVRRMRLQIWAGALSGLFIALCIGAAFIAVFFTTLNDIWSKTEEIWEGTFSLVACLIIFAMGLTMLRIDRSKLKWKLKLQGAFDKKDDVVGTDGQLNQHDKKAGWRSKWALFLLPFITVLREGLEAVVFVGGVSLGQSAKSIPLAAITGLICGFIVGYLIYASGSRVNLTIFLVISTNILFLLGAGLFSKAVGSFQTYIFNTGVGGDVAETGDGPGSYDVDGNVWHLPFGNPENKTRSGGWSIFNAILGWTNNATVGTILSYVFYWIAVIVALVYMKWSEGRTSFFGIHSKAGHRRLQRRLNVASSKPLDSPVDELEKKASLDKSLQASQ
ncbi:high-affinity iron permease [Microbotryomycetes sp. JL221]|nr:high-affinity iron permease [Microbotryomycetes sp. JL221]